MGGIGSGGRRVGAGRKRKDQAAKVLHGTASLHERNAVAGGSSSAAAPIEVVYPPADLAADELRVWNEYAPHAQASRTLTTSTAGAFRKMCEVIVDVEEMRRQIKADGLTVSTAKGPKAHPLLTQMRGLQQRMATYMKDFMIAPIGRSLVDKPTAEDPFSDFDDESGNAVN